MEHVLRRQLASADRAKVGEYWVTMEPYFCGRTFEDSPSPFVDKLTAVSLREMQMTLNTVEFFGPARSPYKEKLSVEETEEARELAERAALLLGKLG